MTSATDGPTPRSLEHAAAEWRSLVSAFMAHSAKVPDEIAALSRVAGRSPAFLAAKGLIFLLLGRSHRLSQPEA